MFTGIIKNQGRVNQFTPSKIVVDTGIDDLELGESISINGVCLTVAEITNSTHALFAVSPETLNRTSLGSLEVGCLLNLERAVTLTTRLSGHLVQGHVDGIAKLISAKPSADRDFYSLEIEIPKELAKYCVEKGSIALDGISLTINSIGNSIGNSIENHIGLMIIPHTWTHTRLHTLKAGAALNVEVDLFAKYVEKLLCR